MAKNTKKENSPPPKFPNNNIQKNYYLGLTCHISLGWSGQKLPNVVALFSQDVIKKYTKLDHQYHSLCECNNTKSNGVTLEAPLQLKGKLCLGGKPYEGIQD